MTQKELNSFKVIVEGLAKEENKNNQYSEEDKRVLRKIRDLLIAQGYILK